MDVKRRAELSISERDRTIQVLVPHGTKIAEMAEISKWLFGDVIPKLPRGCQACQSGYQIDIRERLQHMVDVDLERMEVVERAEHR